MAETVLQQYKPQIRVRTRPGVEQCRPSGARCARYSMRNAPILIAPQSPPRFSAVSGLCDSDNGAIISKARSIVADQKDAAHSLAQWINDRVLPLPGRVWFLPRRASTTLFSGFGTEFNKINLLVAMARSIGMDAGFGIIKVKKEEMKGHLNGAEYENLSPLYDHVFAVFDVEGEAKYIDLFSDSWLSGSFYFNNNHVEDTLFCGHDIDDYVLKNSRQVSAEGLLGLQRTALSEKVTELKDQILGHARYGYGTQGPCWPNLETADVSMGYSYDYLLNFGLEPAQRYARETALALRDLILDLEPNMDRRYFLPCGDDPKKIMARIKSVASKAGKDLPGVDENISANSGKPVMGFPTEFWRNDDYTSPFIWTSFENGQKMHRVIYSSADIDHVDTEGHIFLKTGLIQNDAGEKCFAVFKEPVKLNISVYPSAESYSGFLGVDVAGRFPEMVVSQSSHDLLIDKILQSDFFTRHNIPVPQTWCFPQGFTSSQIDLFLATQPAGTELVVKPSRGRGAKDAFYFSVGDGTNGGKFVHYSLYQYYSMANGFVVQRRIKPEKISLSSTLQGFYADWTLRPHIYRGNDGRIKCLIIARVGGIGDKVSFIDLETLKKRMDGHLSTQGLEEKAFALSLQIYEAFIAETGEDPFVLTPDYIPDRSGNLSVLELNPGFHSLPYYLDIFKTGEMNEMVNQILGAMYRRAMNSK